MAGLVFIKTQMFDQLIDFYTKTIGMTIWVEQEGISILQHENFLVGFQKSDTQADIDTLLTFFYQTKNEVDDMYAKIEKISTAKPKELEKYRIYNFFAKDPEGRNIEFQTFLHELSPVGISWL